MRIEEALEKLFSLHTFGIKLGLENIKAFLEVLGNPQDDLKTFHIAGSNGKGSTSSFIASILMEAGYKTGLYTSPHFVKYNERIKINNIMISDEFIAEFFSEYFDYILEKGLTFFEVTTAAAFCYFRQMKTDYAVIETGLGGRLDATNALCPLASVITSISLEHTNILGGTLKEIALEKAGIIKPGVNAFSGRLPGEALEALRGDCVGKKTRLFEISDYTSQRNETVSFADNEAGLEYPDICSPLRGEYQKYNAALAVLAVEKTLGVNKLSVMKAGVENVLVNTGLECRFENYSESPRVIFESAHNIEGVEVFVTEFQKEKKNYKKNILLFGVMKDKSVSAMLEKLAGVFDEIVFTEINYERCMPAAELQKVAESLKIKGKTAMDPDKYIADFINAGRKDERLAVLGSMYVLGEIKTRFSG
jgi:dihydrofolate synthase/folylpolyglutamate synthase